VQFDLLPPEFYLPSARKVAPALLGHFLLRETTSGVAGGIIVETEAYIRNDPACHANRGKTKRTEVMFGPPGRSYVYLIYGFYHCFNTVCLPEGEAEAVLVRAIEPTFNPEWMRLLRPTRDIDLTSGPGKICAALGIDKTCNGLELFNQASPLTVARNPDVTAARRKLGPIITTTRIGINVAADLPLRFYLDASRWVSKKQKPKAL
jgi:DNA-3-methyladenine glycosylase